MYRQGKYTKKQGVLGGAKTFVLRRWEWWKGQSKKKKFLIIATPILAFLITTPIVTYIYYYNDIGDSERLLNRNNTGVVLMDKDNKVFFSTDRAEHRDMLRLKDISDQTENALVAAEDKDFYEHGGFSFFSIVRALYTNILARGIAGGGSTITQQLAKNTLLSKNQTILRKYQELTIAMAIEQRYSKSEILEMYLNSVYYGENSFGIEEASETYFNKKPSQLDLAESAMLIGVLPAPSSYSPISGDSKLAKARQTTVLTRMVNNGYITESEKTAALKEKLAYAKTSSGIDNVAPHFTEMVLAELYDKYGEEKVTRGGYQVKTTLDLSLQDKANTAVQNGMPNIEANGGSNASLVALDPKTGAVISLIGSQDYSNDKFGKVNMATTPRQPGSSFKPIYYADALASGKITPTTVLKDEETDFGGGYTPQNASQSFYGNVTVRQALDWSLNIPSVKVMQKEGIDSAIAAAKRVGINSLDSDANYGLSLALGSAETPLTQMTGAYAAYANGGDQYDRYTIESIEDKYNSPIYTVQRESHRAISEQGAYLISNILSDNQTRDRIFAGSLTVTGTDGQTKNVAVKTGTTDDNKDAWTIGYTPGIAVGVWTGNNDNEPMLNGGSGMAGPIWREIMGQAIGSSSPRFTQPSGITKTSVCTDIGTLTDYFLSNNVPKECAEKKVEKPKEKDNKKETTQKCAITGKENLNANDAKCKVDMCEIEDKEDLAANDPNCVEDTDTDGDGVVDSVDVCPDTPASETADETGCSPDQLSDTSNNGGSTGGTSSP